MRKHCEAMMKIARSKIQTERTATISARLRSTTAAAETNFQVLAPIATLTTRPELAAAFKTLGIDRVLSVKETVTITSLSRSTIYRHMAEGRFPSAVRIGPGRIGFKSGDLAQWLASREQVHRTI
jgi:prophage regulatory protein